MLDWWDDIWLNEFFVNWFENVIKIVLYLEFQGNMWVDYVVVKQCVYMFDLQLILVLVQYNLSDVGLMDFFDCFVYNKGGYVLQMIENYVGKDVMCKGLQSYLNKYKFGNGILLCLWVEFEVVSGKFVGKVGDSFVCQMGVLFVSIDVQCNLVINQNVLMIMQKVFLNKNVYFGYQWNILFMIVYGDGLVQMQMVVLDQQIVQVMLFICLVVLVNFIGLDYYVINYSLMLWSVLLVQVGIIINKVMMINIVGDVMQLYNVQIIDKVLYDQIVGIQNMQLVVVMLCVQVVMLMGLLCL